MTLKSRLVFCLFVAVGMLGNSPTVNGGDAPPLPDRDKVLAFREKLLTVNQKTISLGPVSVTVSVVHDLFTLYVTEDYPFWWKKNKPPTPKVIKAKIKRLTKKYKKARGKVGLRIEFSHSGASQGNLVVFMSPVSKTFRLSREGMSPLKFKCPWNKGLTKQKFTIFNASHGYPKAPQNTPPVIRRVLTSLSPKAGFDLHLKGDLGDPKKSRWMRLKFSGLYQFKGAIKNTQIDFENGRTRATPLVGLPLEFALPLTEVPVPKGLAHVLSTK